MRLSVIRPVIAVALAAALTGCFNSVDPVAEMYGATMGSTYSIKWVPVEDAPDTETLQADVDRMLAQFDAEVSTWRSDSALAHFNAAPAGTCMDMPPSVLALMAQADQLADESSGAFDVTVAPLLKLWGFHGDPQQQAVPEQPLLDQAMAKVGQKHLRVDAGQLCKDVALTVDFSSIGAGYMVDRVAERLESYGIQNYMVEITGELKAVGRKPGDRPWRIAIEEPRDDNRVAQIILSLSGESVSTSGDYRNYFELDGQRFSHTFDARTGQPVMHRLAAVTVLDPSAMRADGLSTVLMIMGEEAGWDYAVSHQIPAFFVVRAGELFESRATPRFTALTEGEE
ncbi:FAD:protein FMN transferase [Halopseudomonas maritima]|uniref:FAD:protein FMN transferase n=1 Tax=Halopseudomonas maritima TaxID=2918528 RepID=UPI001EECAFE3|nr:FAD:protein FMN transferase [Halopseudomonas maritima]UJJ31254.1 FAD:protein FMN transferase [Halopseudomonas maritima]